MAKARLEIGPKEPKKTPEEVRRALREEEKSIAQARELEKTRPDREYAGRKVRNVTVGEKRRRAQEEASYNAQMDTARKELRESSDSNEDIDKSKAA